MHVAPTNREVEPPMHCSTTVSRLAAALIVACLAGGMPASAAEPAANADLAAALASPARPAEDKARDAARKPVETLSFVGIGPGMSVLEIMAGGGWFSEVLAGAVGAQGKVYAQVPAGMAQSERGKASIAALEARAKRLPAISPLVANFDALGLAAPVDAAFTAQNLHDIANGRGEEAAVAMLKAVFAALKPGGVFGVVDHVGVAGQDNAKLHRMEKATAVRLLEQAGFVVEAESDVLANPADDHTKGVFDGSLERATDQFLLRARKPAA
jgi:predicted methyltransferase